jgi:hypothetical protein
LWGGSRWSGRVIVLCVVLGHDLQPPTSCAEQRNPHKPSVKIAVAQGCAKGEGTVQKDTVSIHWQRNQSGQERRCNAATPVKTPFTKICKISRYVFLLAKTCIYKYTVQEKKGNLLPYQRRDTIPIYMGFSRFSDSRPPQIHTAALQSEERTFDTRCTLKRHPRV